MSDIIYDPKPDDLTDNESYFVWTGNNWIVCHYESPADEPEYVDLDATLFPNGGSSIKLENVLAVAPLNYPPEPDLDEDRDEQQ